MSDFADSISGNDLDLENLKRQVAYTFLDAYGNYDGADILFDLIVKATEQRIIKLLDNQRLQYGNFIKQRPDRKNISDYHAIERTYQAAIDLIRGEK